MHIAVRVPAMSYRISEVYPTIQGEGFYAGRPLTILRLQGCSVGCSWCDTKHSWPESGDLTSVERIVALVRDASRGLKTVLVTGGEPAEQNLLELAMGLKQAGFVLHLETSGTADGHLSSLGLWEWVTVSPKANMPGGRPILDDVVQSADELKFVVGKEDHVLDALAFLGRYIDAPGKQRNQFGSLTIPVVSLQPLSASEKATKICVEAAMQHGFRLSLQQHKILNLP